MGDQQRAGAGPILDPLDQLQDLALDRDIERCRRLVRDDQPGPQLRAIAIMIRWRMPARQLVRILRQSSLRIRDADVINASARSHGPLLSCRCGEDGLGDLVANASAPG